MAYIVSYSKAHETARELGQFDDLDAAERLARKAGAVGEPQTMGRDQVYEVAGHEGDDDFGIWIERSR